MTADTPQDVLTALWQHAQNPDAATALKNAATWAKAQGIIVHVLGLPTGSAAQIAALQAAGARAIASSLVLGGAPMLLLCAGAVDAPERFADHLTAGLQGYERIHALIAGLNAPTSTARITPEGLTNPTAQSGPLFWAILISAPTIPNSYWRPKP